jgi:phage shock protein PspC (stress-responsive transcriptional regulator)
MGPVQSESGQAAQDSGAGGQPHAQAANRDPAAPKRLYQIREGAMLSGVCTGFAAYFNIDVTIVRILFVLLTLLTGGLWILGYIVMMLVIPFANTHEEHAAAAGAPFNAQEVVDRAKKHYAEFKDSKEWRRHWRQQRREWRRRWRDGAYWWGHNLQRNVYQVSAHTSGYAGHLAAGLLIPILAVISVALFCVWIVAIVSLATTGTIFGVALAASMPLWASILILIILYSIIARPLRHLRRALYYNRDGYNYFWFAAWYELMSTGLLILVAWLAYTHLPQVHDFFEHFVQNVMLMWNNILESLRHAAPAKPTLPGFYARLSGASAAAATGAFQALRGW